MNKEDREKAIMRRNRIIADEQPLLDRTISQSHHHHSAS
jgi:hypothetical protein